MFSSKENTEEVRKLVAALEKASQLPSRGKSYKRVYNIFNSNQLVVSWKFNEWDYGKNNISLPNNARGLFILDDPENPKIVARGYDKFFNINETPFTRWDWIEQNTTGPYEVTVKANGCIIFISALEDGTIVVCSKHSTGPRDDVDRNHALAGQNFLKKQLAKLNIDEREFARELYENNVTAVAEYCDDSFEEHILEYNQDKSGLYLHGINVNETAFKTWPMENTNAFGAKYGFKSIESFNKNTISSLREFLDLCSSEGTFKGREIEGFVIRSHFKENDGTFFFKYKFEEPYLMYRQWREVTKEFITNRSRVSKFKKHKFITNKYLDFVIPLFESDPKLCEEYEKGFGIIKLRNSFLESYGMTGLEILNHEKVKELELRNAIDYNKVDKQTKFLIFPIAVIGCGKTTTALTICNLYKDSWGHIQNDDIHGKDKSMLIKKSLDKLSDPNVKCVFVDRNNHQFRERQQLFEWVDDLKEEYLPYDANIKIIGVSFLGGDEELEKVKEITIDRVLRRGDDHQTIKLNQYGEKKVIGIMSGFWKRFQPVNTDRNPDDQFDMMINLKVQDANSSLENAKDIIKQIHETYPVLIPELPNEQAVAAAFEEAVNHKPEVKAVTIQQQKPKVKKLKPSFFSAVICDKDSVIRQIQKLMTDNQDKQEILNPLYELFEQNKIQNEIHITLAHIVQGKRGDDRAKKIWATFMKRYEDPMNNIAAKLLEMRQNNTYNDDLRQGFPTVDKVLFKLDKVCWDDKIVAVIVKLCNDEYGSCVCDGSSKFVKGLECTNTLAHITVGILNDEVKASYSNILCQQIVSSGEDSTSCHSLSFNDDTIYAADVTININ